MTPGRNDSMIDFSKFNDPEYMKERERKKQEEEALQIQKEKMRAVTVGATGHRADKMGGWKDSLGGYINDHPVVVNLRTVLLEVLEDLIVREGKSRFISGGALGFDSMFFWCVNHLKKKYPHIQNVLAIPFVNQHIKWQSQQRKWYFKMLELADEVIDVARESQYQTFEDKNSTNPIPLDSFSGDKMKRRNEYMVDNSSVMVAFYDGSRGGTGHCYRYALNNLFSRPIIIRLDPRFDCKPENF